MSAQEPCDGWVHSLKGQHLVFTGVVTLGGEWFPQITCARRAKMLGARFTEHFSSDVTLVVHGDLASASVVDPKRQYSRKLVAAQDARLAGRHVHVVDAAGFEALLSHEQARCRKLQRYGRVVLPKPEPGDAVFGGPIQARKDPVRSSKGLMVDLSALDRATRAHDQTLLALRDALKKRGFEVRGPDPRAPSFDAGWEGFGRLFIAEVKSLSRTTEAQQIRLGLGQVLDYAHQLRKRGRRIQPVLVLERKPAEDRWRELSRAHGVVLAYGPEFAILNLT